MKQVVIHTDGSCLGNPGPGGWAAVLCLEGTDHRKELAGGFRLTTNNRMEITGVLEALRGGAVYGFAIRPQCGGKRLAQILAEEKLGQGGQKAGQKRGPLAKTAARAGAAYRASALAAGPCGPCGKRALRRFGPYLCRAAGSAAGPRLPSRRRLKPVAPCCRAPTPLFPWPPSGTPCSGPCCAFCWGWPWVCLSPIYWRRCAGRAIWRVWPRPWPARPICAKWPGRRFPWLLSPRRRPTAFCPTATARAKFRAVS